MKYIFIFCLLCTSIKAFGDYAVQAHVYSAQGQDFHTAELVRHKIGAHIASLAVLDYKLLSTGVGENFSVCFTVSNESVRQEIIESITLVAHPKETTIQAVAKDICEREE